MTIDLHKWTSADREALMALCNAVDRTYLSDRLPYPYTEADADWWLGMVTENDGKEGVYRQDGTTAHKAVREALVNCIVHASTRLYEGPVIERYPDRLYFSNPGTMLVSVEDFFEGGHSICRNSALH